MSTRIAAVLLAAGESRRMGSVNKLTLLVQGRPLVRRSAQILLGSRVSEVVVVLGHEAGRIRRLLADLPLRFVVNEDYADGQMTSVNCGLEALSDDCDGVMIALADQPRLETDDIDRLIEAFDAREDGSVLVPTYRGRRGNPVVLSYDHRETILGGGRNLGCRHFIDKNPGLVSTIEMDNDHVVVDLDTPEEYARLSGSALSSADTRIA